MLRHTEITQHLTSSDQNEPERITVSKVHIQTGAEPVSNGIVGQNLGTKYWNETESADLLLLHHSIDLLSLYANKPKHQAR